MKKQILMMAIGMLMKFLDPDMIKDFVNHLKEKLENYVEGTENKIDDFVLNALKKGGDELNVLIGFFLDFIEAKVLGSASKIDDVLVLPIVEMLRGALNLNDED